MKIISKVSDLLGLGTKRAAPPPAYELITDGLIVTSARATAWFVIGTSNTDQESQESADAELDDVIASVAPQLADYQCRIKVLWGRVDGDEYLETLGIATEWDEDRADWVDEYEVRDRVNLLEVVIDPDRQAEGKAMVRQQTSAALGLAPRRVADRELAYYHGQVRSMAKNLNTSPWRVHVAPVETLMWMVSRMMHRDTVLPGAETVTGGTLATLTAGKLDPKTDHLVAYDQTGHPSSYISVLSLSDFPQELTTGGQQEWLRRLSMVHRLDSDGDRVAVNADADVPFRVLGAAKAKKRVEDTRQLAKEQRQSAAKHSAGETSLEFEETEQAMEQVGRDLASDGLLLIESYPKIILSEPTKSDLDEAIAATKSHFHQMGITAEVGTDEQRELWLETLPGDQVRVTDMYQVMEAHAFFGAWWWGGSAAGESAPSPAVGYLTGSTPGLVRHSLCSASVRGDTTTTLYLGRSGRGKTTAMMLGEIDAVKTLDTWCAHLAIKGDDLALVPFLNSMGIPAQLVTLNAEHSGAADPFRSMGSDDLDVALTQVTSQLQLLAPPHLKSVADEELVLVIQEEVEQARVDGSAPTTWGVIQRLVNHPDDENARKLGRVFTAMAGSQLGAPILGKWNGQDAFGEAPGLYMVHFPSLDLPGDELPLERWENHHRMSVALMRAISWYCLSMVRRRPALREMQKIIAIPEMHRYARGADAADFMDQIAKMGRALGWNLALDHQSAAGVERLEGVLEQANTIFLFQMTTSSEQDAGARVLGQSATDDTRQTIKGLGIDPDNSENVRHGHCMIRDHAGRVATMQWVIPTEYAAVQLNTNPDADKVRREYAEQHGIQTEPLLDHDQESHNELIPEPAV